MSINPKAIRGPVTAVPVVAGKGIRFVEDVENNRVVAEVDETVLWEGFKTDIPNTGVSSYTLSELASNFEHIKIMYVLQDNSWVQTNYGNSGCGSVEFVYGRSNTYIHSVMNGSASTDSFILYDIDTNIYNMNTLTWGVKSVLRGQASNACWFHITKIIGINRIANN